ncbi:MAG TPA: transcriptional regulator [Cyanothece sp. UBA12306]|nr:transcriptional regulator [Cyanothece sp. UBA12306]
MTTFNWGDVILVRFPNADFVTYKKRPALIVQSNSLNTGLKQKIVVPITSNLKRKGNTRIRIDQESSIGRQMGLVMDSVIIVDNLATVLEREIDKKIGTCPIMKAVSDALKLVFDL